MNKKPEILKREIVAQSRLFKVESFDLRFSNGEERTYERLVPGGRGAVMILALVDDEHFALIREYAGGIEDYTLTLPKGAIDAGETLKQATHRELQEEIGFGARHFVHLKKLSLSPNYMSAGIDVVLAKDLYESKLEGDEPEPLEVVLWPIAKISELYHDPDFTEGRALAAMTLLQEHLAGRLAGTIL